MSTLAQPLPTYEDLPPEELAPEPGTMPLHHLERIDAVSRPDLASQILPPINSPEDVEDKIQSEERKTQIASYIASLPENVQNAVKVRYGIDRIEGDRSVAETSRTLKATRGKLERSLRKAQSSIGRDIHEDGAKQYRLLRRKIDPNNLMPPPSLPFRASRHFPWGE
jgi:hypothetical protein